MKVIIVFIYLLLYPWYWALQTLKSLLNKGANEQRMMLISDCFICIVLFPSTRLFFMCWHPDFLGILQSTHHKGKAKLKKWLVVMGLNPSWVALSKSLTLSEPFAFCKMGRTPISQSCGDLEQWLCLILGVGGLFGRLAQGERVRQQRETNKRRKSHKNNWLQRSFM